MAVPIAAPSPGPTNVSNRIFIPLLLPFVILFGIAVYAVVTPYDSTNLPPPGARGSLVWGDAIFSNEVEMKAWLKLHGGGSFQVWAKLHPAALSLVKPRPPARLGLRRAHSKIAASRTSPSGTRAEASARRATGAQKDGGTSGTILVALVFWSCLLTGLALGGLALAPQAVIQRARSRTTFKEQDIRVAAFTAGTALLLGVIIATIAT